MQLAFQRILDLCINSHTKTLLFLVIDNEKINRYIFLLCVIKEKAALSQR